MAPLFPPLITGHRLKTGQSPLRKAAAGARKGKFGAGDLLWVEANDTLEYAIILEPTVSRKKALDMVFTMMVALGDAIGALAPPEVAVTYTWPNRIRANGADIGRVEAILSDEDDADGAPRFLVVSPIIAVRPQSDDLDPGLDKDRTTLWDEGCGELTVVDLIDSSARHFMTWLNTWEEDGFTPVLSQIDGRMEKEHALSFEGKSGTFLGMDENANLILKLDQGTDLVPVSEALDTHMEAFV